MPDAPTASLSATAEDVRFERRHIGPSAADQQRMLATLGLDSLDALVAAALPASIRMTELLELPEPVDEAEVLRLLRELAQANTTTVSMLGLGYAGTVTPPVIRRNVIEDPGWYTAYTPYQPEISQGRLEALLNFQTVVSDLTGLQTAGASLLDEPTAAAEAMTLCRRVARAADDAVFLVDSDCHPQTLAVLQTRAEPLGVRLVLFDSDEMPDLGGADVLGALLHYPGSSGQVRDLRPWVDAVHDRGGLVVAACDLLALTLLTPPGEWGADIAVGSAQRFGVPLGYGGPHAGFMSLRAGLERQLPGRLVGVSRDAQGRPAYRLALQTREQHIRREKATSNICTAQVLLAVVAAMYAVYHGPEGLRQIARQVHRRASSLADGLRDGGVEVVHDQFFDTVRARTRGRATAVVQAASALGIDLRRVDDDIVSISTDETTRDEHVAAVLAAFGCDPGEGIRPAGDEAAFGSLARTSSFLTADVFSEHHSETSMLRYLHRLRDKDFALDRGMIPLGSCTMKLNSTAELEPISWPGFADVHPFAPVEHAQGYARVISDLCRWLCEITGYDAVSLQPNSGAQGELAGLLAVRSYHQSRNEARRDVCLIPASAHGTNAASAVLAGMRVVVVATTPGGEVDMADLRAKIAMHADRLAAIMVTYPSTHGVYEEDVRDVAALVHDAGGQVYVDGANLNALVGLAQPGRFGADVSHLNLHKTFCIPHGGGGPGIGPVAVRAHLAPFLPNHPLAAGAGPATGPGPVSGAPWGSAGILTIPWAYIRLMGAAGLMHATQVAVLSANYIARRLQDHYPVLFTGRGGLVAHECVLDLRAITKQAGLTVDDVAKRLIDYGFHAPTMSFPVPGTLMVEPTESENLAEIDRFCEAMIAIRGEIEAVVAGTWSREDNPLVGAPHVAAALVEDWDHSYSRALAVFPGGMDPATKYWPPVGRIDGAWGDRNLMCSCPSPAEFMSS